MHGGRLIPVYPDFQLAHDISSIFFISTGLIGGTEGAIDKLLGHHAFAARTPALVCQYMVYFDGDDTGKHGEHRYAQDNQSRGKHASGGSMWNNITVTNRGHGDQ